MYLASLVVGIATLTSCTISSPEPPRHVSKGAYDFRLSYTPRAMGASEAEEWWGGGFDQRHYRVLSRITGTHKGKPLFIPPSAYAGIAVVDETGVSLTKGGCILTLSGADAGSAYTMKLYLHGNRVTQRIVRLGEFPDDIWEKTTYYFNPPDN